MILSNDSWYLIICLITISNSFSPLTEIMIYNLARLQTIIPIIYTSFDSFKAVLQGIIA